MVNPFFCPPILFFYTCNDFWHAGFVIGKKNLGKKKASDQSEEISNSWEMKAKFQSITFWNHDSLPSQDDAFVRSFHWLTVAKAVSFCLICVLKKKRIKFDQSLVALSLVTWLKMLKFLPSQCHCFWESLRSKCPIHGFEFQRKQQMAYITTGIKIMSRCLELAIVNFNW